MAQIIKNYNKKYKTTTQQKLTTSATVGTTQRAPYKETT